MPEHLLAIQKGVTNESIWDELQRAILRGAFALVFVENSLAETKILGGCFDVFIRPDVFEGALEAEL